MNFSPSDRLSGEPDLLSLPGQTMSQQLKSPRVWTEGVNCLYVSSVLSFLYTLYGQDSGNNSEVDMELSIFVS